MSTAPVLTTSGPTQSDATIEIGGLIGDWNPISFIKRLAIVSCAALVVGLFLPALVTYWSGVFYLETMPNHLPSEARKKLDGFTAEQNKLRQNINRIDDRLRTMVVGSNAQETIASLVSLRTVYEKELESAHP